MKLEKARIRGFQSFTDTGDIIFSNGINLIVGPNNVGKSSILRALQPALDDDRHRTPEVWSPFELPPPQVDLSIKVSGAEIRRAMFETPGIFAIPVSNDEDAVAAVNDILGQDAITFELVNQPNSEFTSAYPSHRRFTEKTREQKVVAHTHANAGRLSITKAADNSDALPAIIKRIWQAEMFYFSAERMNVGIFSSDNIPRLAANASNLPAVLLTLIGSRGDLFQEIVTNVREILPNVGNISVNPIPNSRVEIRIWPTESMRNVDLSFPLSQSGTGVSQVIAILAATVTARDSLLLIDEINSFLHPAAIKALLRVLQTQYSQHQYIISTHSPEVIGFSNPSCVYLVKRVGYESQVSKIDTGNIENLREIAQQIGVSMADVFASDHIIWVEGQTEELCFPLIYTYSTKNTLPRGIVFTSVIATGDFLSKRRDKQLVYDIYNRLSTAAYPLIGATVFSFDSEDLNSTEKEKMVRDSQGKMHFLPRRHIECYLVHPASLAEFIFERDKSRDFDELIDSVSDNLKTAASNISYALTSWKGNLEDQDWLADVDAANVIASACAETSEQRVTFNKKNDTLRLLQIVKRRNPSQIIELEEYVKKLVLAVS